VQIVAVITVVLIISNQINGVDYREQTELGLRIKGQDPMRLMASRGLFLLLFAAFVRAPRDLRLMIGIYVGLSLLTAWSGTSAAMTGGGREEVAEYRAGGLDVLLEAGQNPNRLALLCTLALVFIWEHAMATPARRYRWLSIAAVVLLVLTIFLSASRGGVVGLAFASALLFVRQRQGARGLVYGAVAMLIGGMLVSQLLPPEAAERLTNIPGIAEDSAAEGGGSIERRTYTYGIALDMWSSAPVLGVGLGNWAFVRFSTDPLRSSASAHNSYLKALAEGGAVTLILYLALFYVTDRELRRILGDHGSMARARDDGVDWVVSATRLCLLTFMVFSLFADLWDLVFFYLLFGLAAAVIGRYGVPVRAPARRVALQPA
jgi:O-antigen ligase